MIWRRTVMLAISSLLLLFGCSLASEADQNPGQLSDAQLNKLQGLMRKVDRLLQQGSYGPAIAAGKGILEMVEESAYAAYCLAAAYSAVSATQPDEKEEAIGWLGDAVEWGFMNIEVLENSPNFDPIRDEPEFKKIVAELKAKLAAREKMRLPELRKAVTAALEGTESRPVAAVRGAKANPATVSGALPPMRRLGHSPEGKESLGAEELGGKPALIVVLRPLHDGVAVEMPRLRDLHRTCNQSGVFLLGAVYTYRNTPERLSAAEALARNEAITFPCVAVERDWMKALGIETLPAHVLVDRRGRVRHTDAGSRPLDELEVFATALAETK